MLTRENEEHYGIVFVLNRFRVILFDNAVFHDQRLQFPYPITILSDCIISFVDYSKIYSVD